MVALSHLTFPITEKKKKSKNRPQSPQLRYNNYIPSKSSMQSELVIQTKSLSLPIA